MTLACAAGVGGVEGGRTTKPKMNEEKKIIIGHIWFMTLACAGVRACGGRADDEDATFGSGKPSSSCVLGRPLFSSCKKKENKKYENPLHHASWASLCFAAVKKEKKKENKL